MRACAGVFVITAACSSPAKPPPADAAGADAAQPALTATLDAIRPQGGAWQLVATPACGVQYAVPSGPYEFVHVLYAPSQPGHAVLRLVQAGNGDPVPVGDCPPPDPSQLSNHEVTLAGAYEAAFAGFGQDAIVTAPTTTMLLASQPSDVVALTLDTSRRYLVQRAVALAPGLTLDFTAAPPSETRDVSYAGLADGEFLFGFDVAMRTAGGVEAHFGPSQTGHPPSFTMIPAAALLAGDREHVLATRAEGTIGSLRTVDVDLATYGPGTIVLDFPPLPSTVHVTPYVVALDAQATASWAWNDLDIEAIVRTNDFVVGTYSLEKLPGWPATTLHVDGLDGIGGWQAAWAFPLRGWNVRVCDVQGAVRRCASADSPDTP